MHPNLAETGIEKLYSGDQLPTQSRSVPTKGDSLEVGETLLDSLRISFATSVASGSTTT